MFYRGKEDSKYRYHSWVLNFHIIYQWLLHDSLQLYDNDFTCADILVQPLETASSMYLN